MPDRPSRAETDDSYVLIAGAHRLDAAKALGWATIEAFVETGMDAADNVKAQMWEIAENLHRNELSALDRDRLLAQWIRLSKSAPAIVSAGGPDLSPIGDKITEKVSAQVAAKPQGGRPKGGVRAAARELGVDEDDARRAVKVDSLSNEAKQAARDAGLDNNRSALLAAAKETTPERQVEALVNRRPIDRAKLDRDLRERAISEISLLINDHLPADMRICIRKNFEALGSTDGKAIADAIAKVEARRR